MGLSMLFISHDLSVGALADRQRGGDVSGPGGRAGADRSASSPTRSTPIRASLLDAIPATNPRERRLRTFLTADEIEARDAALTAVTPAEASAPNADVRNWSPSRRAIWSKRS